MGWAQKLCETYDRVSAIKFEESEYKPIVPVGFAEKKADYLVTLGRQGQFVQVIPYGEEIIVPTSSSAETRTGAGAAPYPFFDDFRYMAGDLDQHLSTAGYEKYYLEFVKQFDIWCAQPDAPKALLLLQSYIKQKRLAQDLLEHGVDLTEKDVKKTVAFDVTAEDVQRLWEREDFKRSWMAYLRSSDTAEKRLCYVEGEALPVLSNHPKMFGNAKLISAKDAGNQMRFKGRFESGEQALSISFEASIKIHNTLSWLLDRQGFSRLGMHVVLWSPGGAQVDNPLDDEADWLEGDGNEPPDTMQAYGQALSKAIAGYRQKLLYDDRVDYSQVVVMGLEAATPGRMSITHYQEMSISQYAQNLENWHMHCLWRLERTVDGEKRQYLSAPTPREIANTLYGEANAEAAMWDARLTKAITKEIRKLYKRLLPCIVEKRPLPSDVALSAFRRVCNPLRYTTRSGKWDKAQWERALAVTCALIAKRAYDTQKEEHSVTLDKACTERNYLYGRMLAVANQIEMRAMGDYARQTNAIRYMQTLQLRPVATWQRVNNLLIPYLGKLGKSAGYFTAILNEIGEKIDFSDTAPLDGRFLGGYYAQSYAFRAEAKEAKNTNTERETDK